MECRVVNERFNPIYFANSLCFLFFSFCFFLFFSFKSNCFHRSFQFFLLLNHDKLLELFDLFLHKLLIGCSNLSFNFISNSMHSRLPDLLLIVSNIRLLFTCRTHLTCEVDKVLKSVFFVIDIVAKPQTYFLCRYLCDTLFDLGKIFPDLEWHTLLQLFRIWLLFAIISHMDFHVSV